jgi:hypothetical protein
MLIGAPGASAGITIGETPPTSGSVAADFCAQGTYAVTSTSAPPRYEIPGDGVITSWRTFATVSANVGPERLKVITPVSPTTFKVVAASEYVNSWSTVDNSSVVFRTRIPVVANDLIALGVGPVTSTQAMPHCLFTNSSAQWMSKVGIDDPPAAALLTWGPAPATTYRVSISAVLEPDLDHDGFGDESQDQCVTVAGTENGCPPPAPAPPPPAPPGSPLVKVSGVTVSPKSFRAAASGPSASSARRGRGAKVGFVLDQAATVRFTVARPRAGRTAGSGRCVAVTSRNRHSRKCTRLVTMRGGFSRSGLPAGNSFRFSGRIGTRKLNPGKYRLIATPAAHGRTGAPASTTFSIVK